MMLEIVKSICEKLNLPYTSSQRVHGGDINHAYEIKTANGRFFLKINDSAKLPGMFEKEATGLNALRKATSLKVPEVIASGEINSYQYLALEWLEKASAATHSWTLAGEGLAQLHQHTSGTAGWDDSNYIGSLVQQNINTDNWAEFYQQQRIMPLVHILYNTGVFNNSDLNMADECCKNLKNIFPEEPFALLHGDLWNGNFLMTGNGMAAIFDPAVYYGHREMDIGMTKLFGGFDALFYNAYQQIFPLEKDWLKRLSLTQLYPLLVHAVLFGGSYINQCRLIMMQWK